MKRIIQQIKALWARLFAKKQPKPLFHLEYVYEADVKRQNLDKAAKVKQEQLSEFVFEGEPLYKMEGYGHDFVWGFYESYITKSGKAANHYYIRGLWLIEHEFYEWLDNKFVVVPRRETDPPTFSTPPPFPLIKSVQSKLTIPELISIQPMPLPSK